MKGVRDMLLLCTIVPAARLELHCWPAALLLLCSSHRVAPAERLARWCAYAAGAGVGASAAGSSVGSSVGSSSGWAAGAGAASLSVSSAASWSSSASASTWTRVGKKWQAGWVRASGRTGWRCCCCSAQEWSAVHRFAYGCLRERDQAVCSEPTATQPEPNPPAPHLRLHGFKGAGRRGRGSGRQALDARGGHRAIHGSCRHSVGVKVHQARNQRASAGAGGGRANQLIRAHVRVACGKGG